MNPPGEIVKMQILMQKFLERGPRRCISNELHGDIDSTGPQTPRRTAMLRSLGECGARAGAVTQASYPWSPLRGTRLAHLTFHGLGPLAQFHLQEVQGGDHGPNVADVGVFQLLCSQS